MLDRSRHLFILFALLCASVALGQGAAPADQLRRDVGVWDVEIRMHAAPGGEPIVSHGTETNEMLGDKWLIGRFEGDLMGTTFEGFRRTGFDPQKKAFVTSWVDSTSAYPTRADGEWDEETQTMTFHGSGKDPFGNEMKTKMTVVYDEDGSRTTTMYAVVNGEERKMMEFRYTSASDASPADERSRE